MSASDERSGFFSFIVARPVASFVLFVTLIVVGVIAYRRTPLQMLPSGFEEPRLNVWIPNPGSTALENEEKVARVVEEQLRTLSGIEDVQSFSNEGFVHLWIEFDPDLDLDLAKAEVRDRIERARPFLPSSVEEIGMWSEDADQFPIAFFGVLHPGDSERTDYLIEKIVVPRLEAVPGVSKVEIWGMLEDSVRILLSEDKVEEARLDIGTLIRRLASDNFAMPLGDMDDGGRWTILRSDMRFESPEEIADFPIDGGLCIRDVARVERVKTVRNALSRIDGSYAYFGMASKESLANVVEASHAFRAAIDELERDPAVRGELEFVTFFVQGDLIESSLAQLRGTALWGGALAVLVLFVFLRRVRLTLCVAASIPVAALLAVAFEYFTGGSFNVLTMTGITLGVGMLVDNSIVVVENIARVHQRARRRDPGATATVLGLRAACAGTSEMALAVTLATLTTVVVFVPLIFMSENPLVRTVFAGIGIPLCTSLLASLLVALVFLPVVSAHLFGPRPAALERAGALALPFAHATSRAVALLVGGVRISWRALVIALFRANRAALAVLGGPLRFAAALALAALVAWALVSARPALALAARLPEGASPLAALGARGLALALVPVAVLAIALVLFALPRWRRRPALPPPRPEHLVPRERSVLDMVIAMNRALVAWTLSHRLAASGLAALAFATVVIPIMAVDVAAFMEDEASDSVRFRVAFDADFTLAEAEDELAPYERFLDERRERWGFEHWNNRFDEAGARMYFSFEDVLSDERLHEIEEELQAELPRLPGHRLLFFDEDETGERSKRVAQFTLRGPDSVELERLGLRAIELLERVQGLSSVTTSLEDAPEQLEVEIDRDLAHGMGVLPEVAINTITWSLRGWMLPRYHDADREIPLVIEYDDTALAGLETLRDMPVYTASGRVPLTAFAKIRAGKGSRQIYRENGQTTFTLRAKVDDPSRKQEIEEAGYLALAALDLPRGFSLGHEDSSRARQEAEFRELLMAFLLSVVLVFLLMGILFESVLLPFSVLFTIPFAVLGAMWTILLTGTPMDFMGWIGLIILAGVVVNNGIVLIDRIHRLARAGVPRARAVLDGCSQRVRPILMTALTTVFGLLPMAISEPVGDSVPYRALASIVAGGLILSTFFTLWVVPLAYTLLDDLAAWAKRRSERIALALGGRPVPSP